jgi:alkylation response protein AidB-like acyl-CoA dehydrogenase
LKTLKKGGSDSMTYKERLEELKETFADKASHYDETNSFPHENFEEIVKAGFHTLTLSEENGGVDFGFESTSHLLVELASGCASTSLCLAMHYYTLAGLSRIPDNPMLKEAFQDIKEKGEFISSFNQPNVMLQSHLDTPPDIVKIKIEKAEGGYLINGRKQYVSGSERFKYLPVYGAQENTGTKIGITALMVTRHDPGVYVEKVWNSSAMKGTMSHHIRFDNVFVPADRLIGREGHAIEDTNELSHWSRLAISSVYHGIAKAAINYTASVMKRKMDVYSQTKLAFMPGPQFALAEMKIKFETASSQLIAFGKQADSERAAGRFTDELFQKSLITKYYVMNTANDIVWQAMQIEGMNALNRGELLERLHRDVRAATFHQPTDDLTKELLAKKMLGLITLKKRWC